MNKKKNKNILGFMIVAIMGIAIPVSAYMLSNRDFELRISAFEDPTPKNVFISDIDNQSFKVNWVTEQEVIGEVYLEDEKEGTIYSDDEKTSFHSILVENLKQNTSYEFSILSNGEKYLNEEKNFVATTIRTFVTSDNSKLVYGQIFDIDGVSFQKMGIVSLQLKSGTEKSQVLSTKLNEIGGYQFDIGNLVDENLEKQFVVSGKAEVIIETFFDPMTDPVQKRFTININESQQIPNIYLGDINIDIIPGVEGDVE